ncbi:MAG: S8 family serine peptidase, partial [Bdellovibrionales bacterium]|nr:S8 family serine peptidase [Bdellovibrionales bacterium]
MKFLLSSIFASLLIFNASLYALDLGHSGSEIIGQVPGELILKSKKPVLEPGKTNFRSNSSDAILIEDLVSHTHVKQIKDISLVTNAQKRSARPTARMYHLRTDLNRDELLSTISQLNRHPDIEWAEPNYILKIFLTPSDPLFHSSGAWGQSYDDLWGLKKIRAPEAWKYSEGNGITVAVIDTGVDHTHPDLAQNIWHNPGEIPNNNIDDDNNGYIDDVIGWDFTACGKHNGVSCSDKKAPDNDPRDGHGHGTHVSGTIAAIKDNGIGVAGVAPKAKIMAIKALSDDGTGSITEIMEAIRYAT